MRKHSLILVLALALPCLAAAAPQAYRWTDANGVAHFTDQRPPAGVEYEIINMQSGRAMKAEAEPAATASSSKPAPAAEAEAPAAEDGPDTLPDTPENRARLCREVAQNIQMLRSDQTLLLGDKRMTDEQRAHELQQSLQRQQKFCRQN